MMKRHYPIIRFWVLTLLMMPSLIWSQQSTVGLSGKVFNKDSQEAIEFASITLLRLPDSTTVSLALTDSVGQYYFERVKPGRYFLYADMLAFQRFQSKELTIESTPQVLDIAMTAQQNLLNEVVVNGLRPPVRVEGAKMIVEVDRLAGASSSSSLEILERVPGVWIDENNTISLNGSANVTVLVNGRQKTLSGQQLANLLESIPANGLKSIEVINGKTVEYDARGSGGIINIVTAKKLSNTYNLSLTNRLILDRYTSSSHNANLNWNTHNMRAYAAMGFNNGNQYARNQSEEIYGELFDNEQTIINTTSNNRTLSRMPSISAGLDYDLGDKTMLGFSGSSYFSRDQKTFAGQSFINHPTATDFSIRQTENTPLRDNLTSLDLYLEHHLDTLGSKLDVSFGYLSGYVKENPLFSNEILDVNGEILTPATPVLASLPLDGHQYSAQIDFKKYFSKHSSIRMGLKYTDGMIENFTSYDTIQNESTIHDYQRSDSLAYAEQVAAAYLAYQHSFGDFTIQAGARVEQTDIKSQSLKIDSTFSIGYTKFFPNLTLSYSANRNFQTSINFNSSIERPNYNYVNPYERYIDAFTSSVGNPALKPEIKYNIRLTSFLMQFLSITLGYTHGQDNIAMTRRLMNDGISTLIIPDNAFDTHFAFASVTAYYVLGKGNRLRGQINTLVLPFIYDVKEEFLSDALYNAREYKLQLGTNNSYKINRECTLEQSFRYARGVRGFQVKTASTWALDLGFQYKAWDGLLTIAANVSDIFNTNDPAGIRFFDQYNSTYQSDLNTRRFTLSTIFNFGKLKKDYQKSTMNEEGAARFRK
ncbi:MAG: TonB-dependent receptor [Saprospiraceae bacterium]